MSFENWSDEDYDAFVAGAFESIYNEIPSVPYLPNDLDEQARELFTQGWLTFDTYSEAELETFRQDFYDLVGIPEEQFDWQEYKDLYNEING